MNNATHGQTAHFWDEVVSQSVWFVGVALVLAAVVLLGELVRQAT